MQRIEPIEPDAATGRAKELLDELGHPRRRTRADAVHPVAQDGDLVR